MAYGATIEDWRLFWTAFKTELLILLVCVIMGLLLGLVTGATNLGETWPTSEMVVRATWTNFFVALPVAFISGLGVAVSLLDDPTSSLVGGRHFGFPTYFYVTRRGIATNSL
jgi:ABC-type amino acid transport system permease subunit